MPSTTGRAWLARITVLAAALLAGCGDTALGVTPVGGGPPSAVESERFARRLHLDLSGRPASDEYLVEAVAALTAEGASPSAARAGSPMSSWRRPTSRSPGSPSWKTAPSAARTRTTATTSSAG